MCKIQEDLHQLSRLSRVSEVVALPGILTCVYVSTAPEPCSVPQLNRLTGTGLLRSLDEGYTGVHLSLVPFFRNNLTKQKGESRSVRQDMKRRIWNSQHDTLRPGRDNRPQEALDEPMNNPDDVTSNGVPSAERAFSNDAYN